MSSGGVKVTYRCKQCCEDLYTTEEQDGQSPLIHVQLNRFPKWIKAKAKEVGCTSHQDTCK